MKHVSKMIDNDVDSVSLHGAVAKSLSNKSNLLQ